MEIAGLAAVAATVIAFGLVSGRLGRSPITGPMVFAAIGILLGSRGLDLLHHGVDEGVLRTLAEATLVLLLFTDAIRIDTGRLRAQIDLPGRLLGVGLPLTVAVGAVTAALLLPQLGWWEAVLLAAVLAPTDAALGKAVVTNTSVPIRVRQTINVESGLNDGLMLPAITLFLALAASSTDIETPVFWVRFVVTQVGVGLLVGVAVGALGGRILDWAARREWVEGVYRQLVTLAIGVSAFAVAEVLAGNGFVAAFAAGLAFGWAARDQCHGAYDFAEDEGELLALITFLFFGAAMAGPALTSIDWRIGVFAAATLTVVRMAPVALALLGTHLRPPTVAYIGWFGPRGLASIVFGLLVIEEAALPGSQVFLDAVTWTVLLSIVAHGATAAWLSDRYGRWFAANGPPIESRSVDAMPTR